jgi:hypothetical protein
LSSHRAGVVIVAFSPWSLVATSTKRIARFARHRAVIIPSLQLGYWGPRLYS